MVVFQKTCHWLRCIGAVRMQVLHTVRDTEKERVYVKLAQLQDK